MRLKPSTIDAINKIVATEWEEDRKLYGYRTFEKLETLYRNYIESDEQGVNRNTYSHRCLIKVNNNGLIKDFLEHIISNNSIIAVGGDLSSVHRYVNNVLRPEKLEIKGVFDNYTIGNI